MAIPQDIDEIIEAVGDDKPSLKNCALVSSSFLLPSRRRLWSEISLSPASNCKGLHQLFVQNPVLQSFVTSITIGITISLGYRVYDSSEHDLIAILRLPFHRLQSFDLSFWLRSHWERFNSGLKDAISAIIRSSRLEKLEIADGDLPITFFQGMHVKKLALGIQPIRLCGQAAAPEGGATTASHTVVDHCEWTCFEPIDLEPIFLPFMCRLRGLVVNIVSSSTSMSDIKFLSFIMHSLRISLTAPPTLEHLTFCLVFEPWGENFPPTFSDDMRNANFWNDLDSFVTHPTASWLQRVDIDISYNWVDPLYWPDHDKVVESVLGSLPLLRERGILFVRA